MTAEKKYLAIDIGNTRQKAAVFTSNGDIITLINEPSLSLETTADLVSKYQIDSSILSNVGQQREDLSDHLSRHTNFVQFSHATPLPIKIEYETPDTLGLDRIANAVAAHAQFPDSAALSIQAGTCLVMDFITADGRYWGGSISPGLEMRFKALAQFTHQLPFVKTQIPSDFIGKSTESSISSGVFNGFIDEINGTISRYEERFGDIKIILTGGNREEVFNSIKFTIFATSNFVLQGLFKILIFNEQRKI